MVVGLNDLAHFGSSPHVFAAMMVACAEKLSDPEIGRNLASKKIKCSHNEVQLSGSAMEP